MRWCEKRLGAVKLFVTFSGWYLYKWHCRLDRMTTQEINTSLLNAENVFCQLNCFEKRIKLNINGNNINDKIIYLTNFQFEHFINTNNIYWHNESRVQMIWNSFWLLRNFPCFFNTKSQLKTLISFSKHQYQMTNSIIILDKFSTQLQPLNRVHSDTLIGKSGSDCANLMRLTG